MGNRPEDRIIEILDHHRIGVVVSLPCEKMRPLLDLLPLRFRHLGLNREEEGVGICGGIALAGGRGAMAIQSSGLGNSVNALMSFHRTYHLPLPIIASWRGVYKEKIPAQIPLGEAMPRLLEALRIPFKVIRDAQEVDLVEEVVEAAYRESTPSVALISPRVFEESPPPGSNPFPPRRRRVKLQYVGAMGEPEMTRYEATQVIASRLGDEAVISNIGHPSKELYAIRDRELNFYMLGSLGQASPLGLGLSLNAQKRVVSVLDGDGSILTNPGILASIAAEKPRNLTVFCLDNGTWGSTGDQLTRAYGGVDMELLARAMGIEKTSKPQTPKELEKEIEGGRSMDGPRFIHVPVKPGSGSLKEIPLKPIEIKERFMKALRG